MSAEHPCQDDPRHEAGAPWPIVSECHSNTHFHPGHTCQQSDGSHVHEWVAWQGAPETQPGSGSTVVGQVSGPGIPVRCKTCGGRKCDTSSCMLRRHHRGDHEHF